MSARDFLSKEYPKYFSKRANPGFLMFNGESKGNIGKKKVIILYYFIIRWWYWFLCFEIFLAQLHLNIYTALKVSKYRVLSGLYFPVFGLNTRKYGPEKNPSWKKHFSRSGKYFRFTFSTMSKKIQNSESLEFPSSDLRNVLICCYIYAVCRGFNFRCLKAFLCKKA